MKQITQEYDPAIPLEMLEEHPENPNRGDDKSVKESVDANGFYGAILIQKSSGRIIGGHTRYRVAIKEGSETIPGIWLDVNDAQARKIMLADNRTRDLAFYDDAALLDSLSKILEADGTLVGTGYDDTTYQMLTQYFESDDLFVGNVQQGMTTKDRIEAFGETDNRNVILVYGSDDYKEMVESLALVREKLNLETNSEVALALIRKELAK